MYNILPICSFFISQLYAYLNIILKSASSIILHLLISMILRIITIMLLIYFNSVEFIRDYNI